MRYLLNIIHRKEQVCTHHLMCVPRQWHIKMNHIIYHVWMYTRVLNGWYRAGWRECGLWYDMNDMGFSSHINDFVWERMWVCATAAAVTAIFPLFFSLSLSFNSVVVFDYGYCLIVNVNEANERHKQCHFYRWLPLNGYSVYTYIEWK